MALLLSIRLSITLPWFYFTLLDSKSCYCGSTSLYYTLQHSTIALLHFTLLYSMALRHTTLLYQGLASLYFTLHQSTMALLDSTSFYITLAWFYFTLLDSALLSHGSTSLYLTLHKSTTALLHCI